MSELILQLVHKEHFSHTESWYENKDGSIHVSGRYPFNHPTHVEADLPFLEAVRQYALLTSTEGWIVVEDNGWHNLVEHWKPGTYTFDHAEAHGTVRVEECVYGLNIFVDEVSSEEPVALVDLFGEPKVLRISDPSNTDWDGHFCSVFFEPSGAVVKEE